MCVCDCEISDNSYFTTITATTTKTTNSTHKHTHTHMLHTFMKESKRKKTVKRNSKDKSVEEMPNTYIQDTRARIENNKMHTF